MSTLTRILQNRTFNKSNGPKINEQERKEGKEEREREKKKTELSYVFISSTLERIVFERQETFAKSKLLISQS